MPSGSALGEQLLTTKQVAEALAVNEMTVVRMVERGELPCYRFVRRRRFRASDIKVWLTAQAIPAYRGPESDRAQLDAEAALHETCRCEHAVQLLIALVNKMGTGLALVPPSRHPEPSPTPEPAQEARPAPAEDHDLLSTQEVADLLRVSVMTVHRTLATGRLPFLKIARRYRIRRTDLEAFLKQCTRSGEEAVH